MRSSNCTKKELKLYAVTDRRWLKDKSLSQVVEEAIEAGATFMQIREKDLDQESFVREAIALKEVCNKHSVPLVINDDVEVALKVDADGVHVGQGDMEAVTARQKLGDKKIIGVSVQTVEQAIKAQQDGADYLGVGAVFATGSKDDAKEVSFETLKEICEAVKIPVIAIGGISESNVGELKGTGICGVAVISAIFDKEDIKEATSSLRKQVEKMLGKREITGLIFDMDGTLIDSMPVWNFAGERYLKTLGIIAEPDLGRTLFTMTMESGAEYLIEKYNLKLSPREVIDGINGIVNDFYNAEVNQKPGVSEMLEVFKAEGLPMTVATTTDINPAEAALKRTNLKDCFSEIFTCSQIGAGKDRPDIYLKACEVMGSSPETTVVFEDGLHGIVTAKAAGFMVAGIYDEASIKDQEEIKRLSDFYFLGPVDALKILEE